MVTLIWNDLRHHACQWLWFLLVATTWPPAQLDRRPLMGNLHQPV